MLCNGGLTLADSANGFWQDERIRGLVELTSVTAEPARNPDLNYDPAQPDRLSIDLADGAVVETAIAYPLGAPQRPMTTDQLAAKFHAITGHDTGVYIDLLGFGDSTDILHLFQGDCCMTVHKGVNEKTGQSKGRSGGVRHAARTVHRVPDKVQPPRSGPVSEGGAYQPLSETEDQDDR